MLASALTACALIPAVDQATCATARKDIRVILTFQMDAKVGVASMAMFVCVIIRTFRLVFLAGTTFFSHNKSAGTVFQLVFSVKRTEAYTF